MILDPIDQSIRNQGFNFVPFDRYLASPFQPKTLDMSSASPIVGPNNFGGSFVNQAIDGSETVSVEISSGVTVELARQMISEVRGEEKIKTVDNKTKTKPKK